MAGVGGGGVSRRRAELNGGQNPREDRNSPALRALEFERDKASYCSSQSPTSHSSRTSMSKSSRRKKYSKFQQTTSKERHAVHGKRDEPKPVGGKRPLKQFVTLAKSPKWIAELGPSSRQGCSPRPPWSSRATAFPATICWLWQLFSERPASREQTSTCLK